MTYAKLLPANSSEEGNTV